MCAFDIDDSIVEDYKTFSSELIGELRQNGVLIQAIRQGRTFRIMPSYLTNKDEMNFLKDTLIKSIMEVEKRLGYTKVHSL